MFIEMIDSLRCTSDHPDIWLVAAILRREERFVLEGRLGCPVCLREFPIVNGVAWFGTEPREYQARLGDAGEEADDEDATRIAAFLGAREGASIALGGEWAVQATPLADLVPMRIFALNPPIALGESEGVGIIRSSEGLPLAPASLAGVALDVATATARDLGSAVRALAAGGRLVAPASVPLPSEMAELARDESYWVGEKRSELVLLRRS